MELNNILSLVLGSALAATSIVAAQDESPVGPATEAVDVPVAEEDLETAAMESEPPMDNDELLLAEFDRFKQLVSQGSLDEADTVAKRIIELAIRTKGARSEEMAKALTNLAIVQHRNAEYDLAQQNYQAAIEIIEENEDRLNAQLVNPLKGLAAAQLESGRPDLATTTYGRAVHVTHVNEGPHNLVQLGLLEDLAEVKLRTGDVAAARDIQDTIYALNAREHRADSMGLIPVLMRRAAWQHRAALYIDERATLRRAIRIIQQKLGKESTELVEPLIQLGKSFFFVDLTGQAPYRDMALSSGEVYFKQALRIARENPDASWNLLADAALALGDYYMLQGDPQRGRTSYREVWDLLSTAEDAYEDDKLRKRREELESVVVLHHRPIPGFIGEAGPAEGAAEDETAYRGTISISFNISERGRPSDLKLIEAIPPDFVEMQNSVQREVRRRIYRPRFDEGEPVETQQHVFVHSYWYRQSDLDARRNEAPQQDAESNDAEDKNGNVES